MVPKPQKKHEFVKIDYLKEVIEQNKPVEVKSKQNNWKKEIEEMGLKNNEIYDFIKAKGAQEEEEFNRQVIRMNYGIDKKDNLQAQNDLNNSMIDSIKA